MPSGPPQGIFRRKSKVCRKVKRYMCSTQLLLLITKIDFIFVIKILFSQKGLPTGSKKSKKRQFMRYVTIFLEWPTRLESETYTVLQPLKSSIISGIKSYFNTFWKTSADDILTKITASLAGSKRTCPPTYRETTIKDQLFNLRQLIFEHSI